MATCNKRRQKRSLYSTWLNSEPYFISRWTGTFPYGTKWSQMGQNSLRWDKMVPDGTELSQKGIEISKIGHKALGTFQAD